MPYMNKNVNLILLSLILVAVVFLAGITTFYQKTYKNLSYDYNAKLEEVQRLIEELNKESGLLNQTKYELGIKTERESELSEQFVSLRGIKEQIEGDLADTMNQLESTQSALESTEASLAETRAQLDTATSERDTARARANTLEERISSLCTQLEELGGSSSYC